MKKRLLALLLVLVAFTCVFAACNGTVTVTFNPQNGEEPTVVKFDESFKLPANPVKTGYIFDGWYLDADCEVSWKQPESLTTNITVYAGWVVDPNGGGGGDGGDAEELSQVFAQYNDYDKWNFQINYSAYADGEFQMEDVLQFKGFDCSMTFVGYDDGVTYVDYLVYDAVKGQQAYYRVDENNDYQRYYEEDDAAEYESVYRMDYVELCNLATLSFTKNGDHYSADDPAAAGNEILGEYEGETYTALNIFIANGKITKITVESSVVDTTNGNYEASYELVFSKYNQINFTLPQVGSGGGDIGGGDIGGGDEPATLKDRFLSAVVATPQAGTTYKLAIYQAKQDKVLYWTGEHTSKYAWYMQTTDDVSKAADVVIEQVNGGFYLKCVTTGQYLEMTERSDKKGSGTLELKTSRPTTVMSTDSRGVITIQGSTAKMFLGSYDTYDTISANNVSKISDTSKIDVSQYPARFIPQTGVPASGGNTGTTEKVTISKTYLNLEVDGTDVLTATATSGGQITWTSSNPNVATVVDGTVTAIAKGTATITASCGTARATCTVKVTDATEFLGWDVATPSNDVQTPVLQDKMMQVDQAVGLPSVGTYDVLVIPVEFTDCEYTDEQLADLDLAFNDTTGATGWESVKSFYQKSSGGKLNLNFKIMGVNYGYKGQVFNTGDESTNYTKTDDEKALIEKALAQLNAAGADLSKFDSNGDDCIDAVYMMYSRPFEEKDNDFWWAYVYYYGIQNGENYSVDGVQPYFYFWASQTFMYDDTTTGVSVNAETFIHETGHLLGLDDYYDYNSGVGSDQGLGGAAMMDWNMGDHDPYSKLMLGWITPTVISTNKTENINLADDDKTNDVLLVRLDGGTDYLCEYLLIDVYNATGLNEWRSYKLYGGASYGARIIHISSAVTNPYNSDDYQSFTDDNNSCSQNPLIKLIEADGGNSKFADTGLAKAADLWKTGNALTSYASYYTNKKVTITFTSVSSTGATVSVSYVN